MSILTDIRNYLQQHQRASLDDIALHFDTPPEAIRGMLEHWIARGKIHQCPPNACAGCQTSCSSAPGDIFEWTV